MIAGLDAGKTGALVVLTPPHAPGMGTCIGHVIQAADYPGFWGTRLPDLLADVKVTHALQPIRLVIVEAVHAMPNEGAVGAFSFGVNYGGWLGVLAGAGIPVMTVPPDVWTAILGVGGNKDLHREKARELWPETAHLFKAKGSDGIADAALLAHFGLRFLKKGQS